MAAAAGGIVGGLTGSLFGTIGGMLAGIEEKKVAAQSRRRFRKGVAEGTAQAEAETYDILNSPEFQAVRNFALGTFGLSPGQGAGGGTTFGGETFNERPSQYALHGRARKESYYAGRLLGHGLNKGLSDTDVVGRYHKKRVTMGELKSVYEKFNRSQQRTSLAGLGTYGFQEKDIGLPQAMEAQLEPGGGALGGGPAGSVPGFGLDSPLARDFATSIQQAQTTRGLFRSNAAASAEASGLAAFNFQQQKELLPFLLGLSQAPAQIFSASRSGNSAHAVQRVTGGVGVYGSANPWQQPAILGRAVEAGFAGGGAGSAIGAGISGGGGTPLSSYGAYGGGGQPSFAAGGTYNMGGGVQYSTYPTVR